MGKGEKETKAGGGRDRSLRRRAGWMDGQGEEGGREENWIEVKESKMRTWNELDAVGVGWVMGCQMKHP